jgi:hypothetical protein
MRVMENTFFTVCARVNHGAAVPAAPVRSRADQRAISRSNCSGAVS